MKLQRSHRLAALLATGSLALTGCYSDANQGNIASASGDLTGTLAGAGSSAQAAAMQTWIAGFQSANGGVTVNYDPVGSGGGREQFVAGGVDFAGSDRAFKTDELAEVTERCSGGSVVEVPLHIGPIAIAFNLDGVDEVNLTPETIAKIFNQKITQWNDPAIVASNPGVDLPKLKITPVNRQDDSGTTENFTDYLAAAAPEAWPHEPDGVWPIKGGEAANGTSGVIQAITAGNGAIGYADASQVGDLGTVAVGVGDSFVEYSAEAAAAVVEGSPREEGREKTDIVVALERDTSEGNEYPIVLVSYSIACSKYDSAQKAELVKAFLTYLASEQGQQAAATSSGAAPISAGLREEVQAAIDTIGSSA